VPRWVKKKMENELYQYWDNKKELKEMQQDILDGSPNPPDGMPKGNMTSNPTEQKAIALRTTRSIMAVERRLSYIENAINRLNEDEKKVFEIIFKERHNQKMAETYKYISKDTYYNTYNKIIYFTAVEFGEI
jgi:RinA family phage transcriptional activator